MRLEDLPLAEQRLPAHSLMEALPHLARPFTPEATRWKIQTTAGSRSMVVAHIDARLVIARLNLVFPMWSDHYENLTSDGKTVRCTLFLEDLHRSDVGIGNDAKAATSDSLKRAAVRYGVGISLYSMAQVWLQHGDEGDAQLRTHPRRKKGKDGQWTDVQEPVIDDRTAAALRRGYGKWLTEKGESLFGPPLNHGDESDAAGMEAETAPAPASEPVPEPEPMGELQGEMAQALIADINTAYAAVQAKRPKLMPPAAFKARIKQTKTLDDLHDFLAELQRAATDAS